MARRTLRRVFADVLHGDVTRPPSDADNEAALADRGWQWDGVTFAQQDETRARAARQKEPSHHEQTMARRGFTAIGARTVARGSITQHHTANAFRERGKDMSDDVLGLAPNDEIVIPGPDAATVARARVQHERFIEGMNEHDPKNAVYYKRPDLVAKHRTEAQTKFDAMLLRAGIDPAAPPVTAQTVVAQRQEMDWRAADIPATVVADLQARIAALPVVPQSVLDDRVAALQKAYGETRYEQLAANTSTRPSTPRQEYVRTEGGRRYAELVALAKIAKPDLTPATLADKYTLEMYASYGRMQSARDASLKPRT